jgi:hypothetical protein
VRLIFFLSFRRRIFSYGKEDETDIERNIREMNSGSFAKHIQVVASKFISSSDPKGFGHSEIEDLSRMRNTQVSQDIRKNMVPE